MKLHFTKMHGAGNDFVVLDGIQTPIDFTPEQWAAIADRHFGVGADQLLLVERSTRPDVDFRYRIFNHDGGEVEHCGNGARCFVKFVTDRGLTDKRTVRVEVMNGIATLTMQDDGRVTVDMGAPVFEAARLPFLPEGLPTRAEGRDTPNRVSIGTARKQGRHGMPGRVREPASLASASWPKATSRTPDPQVRRITEAQEITQGYALGTVQGGKGRY